MAERKFCESEAQQIKEIYSGYLSGLSCIESARRAGLELQHGSVKRLLRNRHYLGDDFYPAIIGRDVFDAAEQERQRRSTALGRDNKPKRFTESMNIPTPTRFVMKPVKRKILEAFEQAEYIYSLIEKEE